MSEASQTFFLPFPPTANTMWRTSTVRGKQRTYPSAAYQNWKDDAGMQLALQKPRAMRGPVCVEIKLHCPDRRRWDADNRIKPCLDLLVAHLVLADDSIEIVRKVSAEVDLTIDPGAQVTITKVAA